MTNLDSVISKDEVPSIIKYTLTPSSAFLTRVSNRGSRVGQEEPRKVERRI